MTAYLVADGERMLLDTTKAKLDYEGRMIDLTGQTLALYEASWEVGSGTLGEDAVPCRVLVLMDPFTHLRIEVPMTLDGAARVALGLVDDGDGRRMKKLRKLLRSVLSAE